jgi:hypothetical protein
MTSEIQSYNFGGVALHTLNDGEGKPSSVIKEIRDGRV